MIIFNKPHFFSTYSTLVCLLALATRQILFKLELYEPGGGVDGSLYFQTDKASLMRLIEEANPQP